MSMKAEKESSGHSGPAGKMAAFFIDSKLTPLIIIASVLLGIAAVIALPREEEPQIIVPMIDIFVQMPGAGAKEVEQRVTRPMEKLLWEIPGVEYIYSTSSPGMSVTIVRFLVGQDEERSIVRLRSKLMANYDRIPYSVSPPLIKPRYIDDVPILALTFHSEQADHFILRRLAAEVEDIIKKEADVSVTSLIGGEQRQVTVYLDPLRLAAYGLDTEQVSSVIMAANRASHTGSFPSEKGQIIVHTGGFFHNREDAGRVIIHVHKGRPVYLRDVATIIDGPGEPEQYVFFGTGPAAGETGLAPGDCPSGVNPAVTLTVAKRKGSNAIAVAENVLARIADARKELIPDNIHMTVTRHYGETAKEKSDELLWHMLIAVISVTLLIWFTLGHRESGVVAFAIPVTLALTLSTFYLYGYTLNRITLFALIFSIGILVDDAIVVVENIVRHYRLPENEKRSRFKVALEAVDEVGNPTILATLTVIAAILPMAFVGGLMGPYMRPIPVGASAAMVFSLLVAFIVTPWASVRLIRHEEGGGGHDPHKEDRTTVLYRKVMDALLHNPLRQRTFLISVILMLLLACAMVALGMVKVKMLPFDNKSEFQVILDMPETATLEETAAAAMEMGEYLKTVNEVTDYQIYAGTASPFNFNGLVRHYFLREGANMADIQVNLVSKSRRKEQSHEIAKRVRPPLKAIADRYGARVKIAEVPPGPPVLSTLVAEVYGPDYERQREIALQIRDIFENTEGVVDTDWYMEEGQQRFRLDVDQEKAALHGISVARLTRTLETVLQGRQSGLFHRPLEKEDVAIFIHSPLADRAGIDRLKAVKIPTESGPVALCNFLIVRETENERSIYHKNLMPAVYVTGDVAGAKESPIYAILEMRKKIAALELPEGYRIEQHTAGLPKSERKFAMKWDGEWHITYEVFRDLGIAFGVVLILIFVLVVGWFQSFSTPFVIMTAIPFSLIGILPAHWAMNAFFTATSMIGFIAGAGIVVRNSIILVDFIELRIQQGMPLDQAVIDAGAVRFRPMMLTAAAVVVGASVILFDPIFQGLAISLMAGEVASLLFSRMTVPILYFLDKRWEGEHLHHGEAGITE
ncbi:MAG: efflux RND transporter permease subunit [Desulfococcaceae bacterium]|jgi:multidrug efflux pump subunit AcrB|nr:efflux RND transporter permease subunit [Desulfococcaceae bacterium]